MLANLTNTFFQKEYEKSWSEELLVITIAFVGDPPYYKMKDLAGEEIRKRFYEKELQLVKKENDVYEIESIFTAPINSRLNMVVRSPTLFGLSYNDCWPSRGSQLAQALPFVFSPCCLLNDCKRAA